MLWIGILVALVLLFLLVSRGRRAKHQEAIDDLRLHFSRIARMRLIAACPGLEGSLEQRDLRLLFDWMLIQLCRRTGASGPDELMRWALDHGQAETIQLSADVARESVERLPHPVLEVIDGCSARMVAAVLIDQALAEAGQRIEPRLKTRQG